MSGWGLGVVKVLTDPFTMLSTTGSLSVSANPGDKYTLRLQTLQNPSTVGQDNLGMMANFNLTQPITWTFLTYEGSYSGPADLNSVITIDRGQFANTPGGNFSISLDTAAHTVGLSYTPVPEPGVVFAVAAAGIGVLSFVHRVRRGRTA